MKGKTYWEMVKETGQNWIEDKAPRLGAALAYYSVFSIAPLLLIAIALAGMVFGEQAARGEVLNQISGTVGPTAARAIEDVLKTTSTGGGGTLATVVGVVLLFFGASGFFIELQDALNTIWKVVPKPGLGLLQLVRDRLLSFAVVLATGFLLLVSLLISAALVAVGHFLKPWADRVPGGPGLWLTVNLVVTFVLITLMFALIYKVLPDVKMNWRDVWVGAVVAALLFSVGKYGIGLYLGRTSVTSAFGAAGSVIVILVWVYYSTQILLFGAEFTRVYALRRGSHIVPSEHAQPVTVAARANQGLLSEHATDPAAGNVPRPVE